MTEKNEPTWLDHLGDRKPEAVVPVAIERISEPDDGESGWSCTDAYLSLAIGTATTLLLALLRPPAWMAAIGAAIFASLVVHNWETIREARRGKA